MKETVTDSSRLEKYLHKSVSVIQQCMTLQFEMDSLVSLVEEAIENGHKIMWCGNGSTAAEAQHMSAELVGRFKINRKALSSISLTTDTSVLTAVSNDFDFQDIFARQVEALGEKGDLLICLSTSGSSPNILKAAEVAKTHGITSVLFSGKVSSPVSFDLVLRIPSEETSIIQQSHQCLLHFLCGEIESRLFSK